MGFEDEERLATISTSGAVTPKYVADQCPVKLVNASVTNGTLLVEVSNDDFAADVRPVINMIGPAAGPVSFDESRFYVLKTERVRITTTGGSCKAFLRTTIPGLKLLP